MPHKTEIKLQQELQDMVQDERIKATQRKRSELEALRRAQDEDKLLEFMSKANIRFEGQDMTLWQKVVVLADRAIHSEQNAYNDWRSAMMSLLSLFSSLVDAANHSLEGMLSPIGVGLKQLIREKAIIPLKDWIMDKLRGAPRVKIPELIHNLSMGTDNKINYGSLARADGGAAEMTKDDGTPINLNQGFQTVVALWLYQKGYVPAKEEGKFVRAGDEEKPLAERTYLTQKEFYELKNSPEHGLNAFLQATTGLDFTSGPEPELARALSPKL